MMGQPIPAETWSETSPGERCGKVITFFEHGIDRSRGSGVTTGEDSAAAGLIVADLEVA